MVTPLQEQGRPSIRVTSYNVLADSYATKRLYPTVPPELLNWSHRGPMIVSRIQELNPDVVCLQEVEAAHWTDLYASLVPLGWEGIFAKKGMSRVDGCALLYRTGTASLQQSEAVYFSDGTPPSGHLALVGVLATGIGLVRVASTHLRWQADTSEPESHIGYRQAAELLRRLSSTATTATTATTGATDVTIICGDLNIPPQHPLVQLFLDHGFSDAYAASPQWTCAPNGRPARIDYIFASGAARAVGERVPALQQATLLPNVEQPSDHLPITARIELAAVEI